MTATVELHLRGTMDHLRLVWQTGETLLESVPFEEDPEGTRYNVLLALQEMVTNVLRHGYSSNEHQPVQVVFEARENGFELTLRDRGPEFNPLVVETAEERSGGGEMPTVPGGYGIMITRMVMDSMEYEHRNGWNVLKMRKSVRASVTSEAR
jgi:anti-sigma regulatory factor (Ser/Thr protein kinase)